MHDALGACCNRCVGQHAVVIGVRVEDVDTRKLFKLGDVELAVTAPRPICENKSGEASCFFNTAQTVVRVLHVSTGFGS